jgi:hypothetical protein
MTSELPVPQRIRDWFVELPVAGTDMTFEKYSKAITTLPNVVDWPTVFHGIIDRWISRPPPVLQEIKEVKAYVYEMLMRNLRWVEATHFLLDVLLTHTRITHEQREKAIHVLASQEATGGGYTIPSYRIPILWESLFLQFRTIFSKPELSSTAKAASSKPSSIKRKKKQVASVD